MPNENKQCVCGEQELIGNAEVEIGGVCHRPNNPCYAITPSQEEKFAPLPRNEKLEEMRRDVSTPSQPKTFRETEVLVHQAEASQPKWEELFDEGFVWEEAAQGMFALFRVCNEADNTTGSYDFRGSRTLAKPEYIKAFIRQLLATKIEIEEVIGMIDWELNNLDYPEGADFVANDALSSLKQKLLDLRK